MKSEYLYLTGTIAVILIIGSSDTFAQDIPHEQISASTDLVELNAFKVNQISDGIWEDREPYNGFATEEKRGVINLGFNQAYDINGFKLWNDINIGNEGIASFQLEFQNADGLVLKSKEFAAVGGISGPQIFTFPDVDDVIEVNLAVINSLKDGASFERIEVREIAFSGTPSNSVTKEDLQIALNIEKDKNANQTKTINLLNNLLKAPLEQIKERDATIADLNAELTQLNSDNASLKSQSRLWKMATGLFTLLSLGLFGLQVFRPRGRIRSPLESQANLQSQGQNSPENERPSKPIERPEDGGVVFAGSPLAAANVTTPLSPAGQLTASNLQMLKGPFQVLRPAYHATGRIGYAQEGKPTSEDYSFGTGFLITPNHVMTNRHVHGFYGHYLTTEEDCGGIEFIAEKDKDASDFIPFNGQPPLLLDGLDIAIYTLSRSAGNRTPINRVPIPTEELEGRDIAVVGYPDTNDPNNPDILAVVEDNPIFAVKRISQGKIFRHSTDDDDPYGVEVNVNEDDKKKFPMPAICHNASTLGGNSGSPILDLKTGELLGVHFAGHKIFNEKEAANLAMAISQLTEHSDIKNV